MLNHLEVKYGEEKFCEESFKFLSLISDCGNYAHLKASLKYLLSKEYLCVPILLNQCLRFACVNSDLDLVTMLSEKGANVNSFNGKLLSFAAAKNMDMLNLLLDQGANPSLPGALEGMKMCIKWGEM